MNLWIFFLIPLASGSVNTFDDSFVDPSISETKMFNELKNKFLKIDVERKDVSGILQTFEKPFIKTFACNKNDVNELVVNVVETRVGGFSQPDSAERGVILGGTYTWQCRITTSEEGVITIDCDNSIQLNPEILNSQGKDPRVHEIENIVIFYHELLHGQLMLDAISSSEKWRNDVCNKTPQDAIDLSYSDKNHEIIGPLQIEFTKKLVETRGGVFIIETINPVESNKNNFTRNLFTPETSFPNQGIKVTYRVSNISSPSLDMPQRDIIFTGSLEDKTKEGMVWLYIFPDSSLLNQEEIVIPSWIKKNAFWWSEGKITDSEFLMGINYFVENKIIIIDDIKRNQNFNEGIPIWIRNNAKWWSQDLVSDLDFVSSIKYLIEHGIIAYRP